MELYDKKYVYFEWDDKLEGKKVILAHTIKNIKEFVGNGNKGRFFIVQKGNDLPFTNGLCECEFAYYDPNYEVKKAYNEGKEIQYKYRDTKWHDWILEKAPSDESFEDCEWRVKPETVEYKEPEKDRYLTNKELAVWLATGYGQVMDKAACKKSTGYDYWEDDKAVDYMNLAVRKWEDDDWHKPTYSYCFGDK